MSSRTTLAITVAATATALVVTVPVWQGVLVVALGNARRPVAVAPPEL